MATYNIKHILAPVDLSESSLNAVAMAAALARATGAYLQLLYVEESIAQLQEQLPSGWQGPHHDVLPALAASLETKYQVRVALQIKTGPVCETLLQTAHSAGADLIVLGKHGASGIRDGFAGHNTYYTVKYSSIPVLVVPASCTGGLFTHLIYPFRLMEGAQMRHDLVLPFLATGATIELLSIAQKLLDVGNRALHDFSGQVRNKCAARQVQVKIAQGTSLRIGKELVHYASRNEYALVVVNNALDMNSRFIGPHTQAAINGLKNPFLYVPLACEQATKELETAPNRMSAY